MSTGIQAIVAAAMERIPAVARLYYGGSPSRRYRRASVLGGPGEPLVHRSHAERELHRLAAELRALEERLAACSEDAERYRWLRSEDIEVPDGQREIVVRLERLPFREDQSDEILAGAELDAAIDSAKGGWVSSGVRT